MEQRAWSALLLLVAIGYGAHLIQRWLASLLPTVFVLLALLALVRLFFRRR
jgi:hypothetical protein